MLDILTVMFEGSFLRKPVSIIATVRIVVNLYVGTIAILFRFYGLGIPGKVDHRPGIPGCTGGPMGREILKR